MARFQRSDDPDGVLAIAPLRQSTNGVSASFLVRAADGRRYWCKTVNNPVHTKIPVNEQLAGRVGRLLGIATCEVTLVRIPDALVGWRFSSRHPHLVLEEGWAHGSAEVPGALETRTLNHRGADDNARRHVGFYALHDWLGGADVQWLVCGPQQNAYFSHDHGHYFPGGPGWTVGSLRGVADSPRPLAFPTIGLDAVEAIRISERVLAVTEGDLVDLVANLPASWPVSDLELEALVEYLLGRRAGTAARLHAMIA